MFTILCCNLKDFISKSPKPWRLLETTFLLLSSSKMYLPVLHLRRPMCQDNFKSTLLFIAICSYSFCRHFFVYTNFLDSWDTILDRTIQIQFTYLQKKRLRIWTVFCGSCFFKQIFE